MTKWRTDWRAENKRTDEPTNKLTDKPTSTRTDDPTNELNNRQVHEPYEFTKARIH